MTLLSAGYILSRWFVKMCFSRRTMMLCYIVSDKALSYTHFGEQDTRHGLRFVVFIYICKTEDHLCRQGL